MALKYQVYQSQKTQGFCVADFATPSDERTSRSKIFLLFIWIKEPCVRKFEGLARSKLLGISQTDTGYEKLFEADLKYEFHTLPNTKLSAARHHGENYIRVMPPLIHHLLHYRLFYWATTETDL